MHHDDLDEPVRDREISLGATTILGIFLALTLVCALFFGLGFSMGRRSAQTAVAAVPPPEPATANKPSPEAAAGSLTPVQPPPPTTTPTATVPLTPATPGNSEKPTPKPAAASNPASASYLVQIAAVSHREDADSLLAALEQRGYVVYIRQEPQDKLLHVQIGPFTTRRDADAMRQHLLADGYNAIVK